MTKKMIGRASKSRLTLAALGTLFLLGGANFVRAQQVIVYREQVAREMNEWAEQHPHSERSRPVAPQQVATDGSWNVNASGGWDVATNWLGSSIADGAGATGNFLFNITTGAGRTVTIDGAIASRTLGIMNIGDTNASSPYTIAAINGGTLTFDNTPNVANAQINMVSTSAQNQISAPVQLNSSLDISNVSNPSVLFLISGNVSSIAASGTQTITALSGNETISGSITNGVAGGTVAVTQSGSGTLTLTGAANTYSGSTTISNGKISINGTSTLGDGTGTLFLSGGTLVTSANRNANTAPVANNISLTADSAITTTSAAATVNLNLTGTLTATGGTLTFRNDAVATTGVFAPRFSTGDFTMGQPIVLDNGAGGGTTELADFNTNTIPTTHTYNGVISGNGSFRRGATTGGTGGETDFNAANTFSGGVNLNDGTIGLGVDSVGAPGSLTSGPLGTGTLTVSGSNANITALGGARIVGNAITLGNGLTIFGANNLELSGAVNLGAVTRTIKVSNPGVATISGVISGAGGLTKSGNSTLVLTNANTYGGATTINGGTLQLGNNGTTGSLSTSSAITDNNIFKINRSNAVAQGTDFSGAAITGTGSLVQAGFGTTTLNVANSYSGGTIISGTGVLTANAGHASHTPNGGTNLIAAADGALGSGNVSLTASGARLTLQGGVINDYISDNSTLSMVTGATADLNFTGTDIVGGLVLGGAAQTNLGTYGSSASGAMFVFDNFFLDGGTLTLVPEPSTWVMTIVGASLLLSVQRFRRKKS
jgi:autotransporter-associated beta strand protein